MRHRDAYRFPFASYPAVRIMLLMVSGILIAKFFSISVSVSLYMFAITLCGWMTFEFIVRKKHAVFAGHAASVFNSSLIIVASLAVWAIQNERLENQFEHSGPLELYEWEELTVKGEVIGSGKGGSGRPVLTVNVKETTLPNGIVWNQNYNVRLYSYSNPEQVITDGEKVEAAIRLYEFPERRNPHEFNYGVWLHSQGISAHGELQEVIRRTENKEFFSWGSVRNQVLNSIDTLFDDDEASLAKALILGHKDDLTPDTKQKFSRAGLSHIMAVSGLHVGFIVAPLWFFIPYLWGSKKGKWAGMIFLTVLLIGYAGLTGFSASVSRASLMAWLLTYGRLFHKVRNSINLTALAAIILLMIDPAQLFDPGFQLSFSAVFIILLVMPEAQRLIPQKYQFGWKGGLMTIILVSIVVQLGLFPILMAYFGEFSVAGPLSNALVIPLLTIAVPAGLIVVLASSFISQVIQIVAIPLELMLQWIQAVASFTGGSRFSFISMNETPFILFFIWLFAILMVASLRIPKIRWKMVICLFLSINVFLIDNVIEQERPGKLKITFLDIGQGDAIHIKTPNNKHLLVDAGRWSPAGNSGRRVILPYLEEKGIHKLDAVMLSHPHADHIGGIVDLLQEIPIDTVYQSNVDYDSDLYITYRDLAVEHRVPVKYQKAGDMIHIDPSIRVFVLGPEADGALSNINNRSLVFKLAYGNTSVLFSGDAEKEQEKELADRYGDFLKSDLYKVGHHGSNTSSSEPYMRFVEPEVSVASLAFRNRFNHPGSRAISTIHQYSEHQYYTSLAGAVVFESDGNSFERIDWKK